MFGVCFLMVFAPAPQGHAGAEDTEVDGRNSSRSRDSRPNIAQGGDARRFSLVNGLAFGVWIPGLFAWLSIEAACSALQSAICVG